MAYIVVLNPIIIGTQADSTGTFLGGGKTPNLAMVAACTALVAGVMTLLMGVVANYPLALATGLGLNAFLAFGVAKLPGMTWPDAMGLIVIEGIIILLLVLTGFRQAVFRAVPTQLKTAISVGIGLFITVIGLVDAGFVRTPGRCRDPGRARHRRLPQRLAAGGVRRRAAGHDRDAGQGRPRRDPLRHRRRNHPGHGRRGHRQHRQLHRRRQDGQAHRMAVQRPELPSKLLDIPDFGLLGHFSLLGSFSKIGIVSACLLIFTLMLADFFDTMGTMVAIGAEAGLLDEEGNPPNAQRILIVDSVAAAAGGAASVSSNTSYIESASGVGEGARTGLASVVTGVLFLIATFLSPLVSVVPYEAATPALVIVGFLMMQQVRGISWDDLEIAIPAFLTIVLMPFTYSITVGIGAGLVVYTLIKVVRGKSAAVHPLLWVVSALFVLYFAIEPVKQLLGVS